MLIALIISTGFAFYSCIDSAFIKEERLGNNFILSEFDNVDRRIFYCQTSCSGSGIEIVPMTVTEYAQDKKWIIAKSRTSRFGTDYQYWIINKDFTLKKMQDYDNTLSILKSNVYGPFDSSTFITKLQANSINLILKKI